MLITDTADIDSPDVVPSSVAAVAPKHRLFVKNKKIIIKIVWIELF